MGILHVYFPWPMPPPNVLALANYEQEATWEATGGSHQDQMVFVGKQRSQVTPDQALYRA